jgi:hypothetical protein
MEGHLKLKYEAQRDVLLAVLREIVDAHSIGLGANSAATAAALRRARKLLKEIDA